MPVLKIDFLLANGCNSVQGYYFSKPLPTAEFEHFIKENLDL